MSTGHTRLPVVSQPELPIARVLPLLGVPHLDRLFDYSVPESLRDAAQPGVRVRVRFAGRLVNGLIVERRRQPVHDGAVKPLERVVSPVVVCPPDLWKHVDELAARSAGVRSDILRAAIPPRHAAAEKAGLFASGAAWEDLVGSLVPIDEMRSNALQSARVAWAPYKDASLLTEMLSGHAVRGSVLCLASQDPAYLAACLVAAVAWNAPQPGALVVVPNQRELDRVASYMSEWMSDAQVTHMSATAGSHARYRRYLSIVHGQARVVVGTRSASLLPIQNLGLVVVLGESDESLIDPRAPYLNARDVAKFRAEHSGASFVTIGVHRSAELQQWVENGEMESIEPPRHVAKAALPAIRALGEDDLQREREAYARGARVPGIAFHAIRQALDADSAVLVQVPRRGYAPALSCASCRTPARCRHCNGPLELPAGSSVGSGVPRCRWCGAAEGNFTCQTCGNHGVRMTVVGQERTAEELGRAFPGVPIVLSGGDHVLDRVHDTARIVVATPGAEPRARYGCAVMLDPWITLGREDLRAQEHAIRQWMHAVALVRPSSEGGVAVLTADASLAAVRSVIGWDPGRSAAEELEQRRCAHFPPATSVAAVDGSAESIEQLLAVWERPGTAELLGPVELPPGVRLPAGMDKSQAHRARRLLVRVPHEQSLELGASLKQAQAVRATMKNAGPLRVVMNPVRIG